jgi:RNA polymerase sigma-70 factor (ECF subfamily)
LGGYHIEAAIQSAHVVRRLVGVENWPAIVALYDHLLTLTSSPVVALNRAAALSEVEGPAAGLGALDAISGDRRLADYHPHLGNPRPSAHEPAARPGPARR